ncbi:MAG TPA: hypothetical protein VG797_02685 [Phycisphaerales bacterium]|nr:hypothetical protein [Phycisphaerales bacterium]
MMILPAIRNAGVEPVMRIIIRPVLDPQREIDLTERLVSVVAEELWRLYGGNDRLDWFEAERHLEAVAADALADPSEIDLALIDADEPSALETPAHAAPHPDRVCSGDQAQDHWRRNARVHQRPRVVASVLLCAVA